MADAELNEQVLFLRDKMAELDLAAIDRDAKTGQTTVRLTARGKALQADLQRLHAACREFQGDKQDLLDTAILLICRGG